MAANRVGKTICGTYEVTLHLTGDYPDWWPGIRFEEPTDIWVAGDTSETTRNILQKELVGPSLDPEEFGMGLIPRHLLLNPKRKAGMADALDSVSVRNKSGGRSRVSFKSFDQGRKKFQGTAKHVILLDEECPMDVYSECLLRTLTTGGIIMLTFTPLSGLTPLVREFRPNNTDTNMDDGPMIDPYADSNDPFSENMVRVVQPKRPKVEVDHSKLLITCEWADVPHISEEDRERFLKSMPEHEREARSKGLPILGSGLIFPISQSAVSCQPFPIPDHFKQIGGMDFGGFDHPFAAAQLAIDPEHKIFYVTRVFRKIFKAEAGEEPISESASVLRKWDKELRWAWPHDGKVRDRNGSGVTLSQLYKDEGLKMLPEHATHKDGSNSTEPGVRMMFQMMFEGRLKIFENCFDFFEEMRQYHRKDGKIVREDDDVISAVRYAIMMSRYARVIDRGIKGHNLQTKTNSDYNRFQVNGRRR